MKTIKICEYHQDYQVPLIWTFAFRGVEYWCPYCGNKSGMLGAGVSVDMTETLKRRLEEYKEKAEQFLFAQLRTCAIETEHEGAMIRPADLPDSVKEADVKIRTSWKYYQKIDEGLVASK